MGLFNWKKKKSIAERYACTDEEFGYEKDMDHYPDHLKLLCAQDRGRILTESLDLISKTVYPETFFSRYKLALKEARVIIRLSIGYESQKEMMDIVDTLLDDKIEIFDDFFDRCDAAGKLPFVKDQVEKYRNEIPTESYEYYRTLLDCHTDEDDEDEYIICSVEFSGGGKSYYYLSDDDAVACGDYVIVPVGRNDREETARVVKVETCKGKNAPIPVDNLKYIIDIKE